MRKWIAFCSVFLLSLSITIPVQASAHLPISYDESASDVPTQELPTFPELVSDKLVVMDADTGEVLYQRNGDLQCYPASTTKLLTALLSIENCAMDEVVTYSKACIESIEYGDANAAISVGEELTVEQSLYCLLLRSANDAAYGLAEHTSGNISSFAELMNMRAQMLGCENTHFTNASGLHDSGHYSTPYDMSLIARECMQNKTLMSILNYTKIYTIAPTNTSNFTRYYRHRYAMVEGGAYAYPYSLGGKTGFTENAACCLISYAQKDDLRLIVTIMDSTDDGRYLDTIALFNYYFNNFHKVYLSELSDGLSSDAASVLSLTKEISSTHNVNVGFTEGSYLLVPNAYGAEDLTSIVTYSDNIAYTGKPGGFACVSYFVKNFNVGNATLFITEYNSLDSSGLDGVPLRSHRIVRPVNELIYINILYIIGAFFAVSILAGLIVFIVYCYRHRRGRSTRRKLRF